MAAAVFERLSGLLGLPLATSGQECGAADQGCFSRCEQGLRCSRLRSCRVDNGSRTEAILSLCSYRRSLKSLLADLEGLLLFAADSYFDFSLS